MDKNGNRDRFIGIYLSQKIINELVRVFPEFWKYEDPPFVGRWAADLEPFRLLRFTVSNITSFAIDSSRFLDSEL